MKNIFKNIEQKFAWSFTGAMIGIVFGSLGIYVTYFEERSPNITATIISEVQVVDIKENISDLKILYRNKDILSENKSLKLYTINIQNSGSETILKSFYDEDAPFGVVINNGDIIENPSVVGASSDYLKENFQFITNNANKLTLKPIIFESNQEVQLKLLVLHDVDISPTLELTGKIAHVSIINPKILPMHEENSTFLKSILNGSITDQIGRIILYPSILLILFLVTSFFLLIPSKVQSKKRNRIFTNFITDMNLNKSKEINWVYNRYIENGVGFLVIAQGLNGSEPRLQEVYGKLISDENYELKNDLDLLNRHRSITVFQSLINYGLLSFNSNNIQQNNKLGDVLEKFLNYLCLNYPKDLEGYRRICKNNAQPSN